MSARRGVKSPTFGIESAALEASGVFDEFVHQTRLANGLADSGRTAAVGG